MTSLLPLCALAMLLGACGGEESGGSQDAPKVSLSISYRADAAAEPAVTTLECDPTGGSLSNADDACRQLLEVAEPFDPLQPDMACTEIYGGPQTATVTGTFRGDSVDASFSRTNGCEISHWDQYGVLFPTDSRSSP